MLLRLTMTSRRGRWYKGFFIGFDHGVNLFLVNAGHQMLVFVNNVSIWQQCLSITPFERANVEESFHILRQFWQYWLKINRKAFERIQDDGANFVQFGILPILFCQPPWFVVINKLVHEICQIHNFSESSAIIALFIEISNIFGTATIRGRIVRNISDLPLNNTFRVSRKIN